MDDVSWGLDGIPEETRNLSSCPGEIRTSSGFWLRTIGGDLFTCPASVSLCHCVSRDFRLGFGIAKTFRANFGRIDELKASGAPVGGIAVLREGNRFIYNLVTKEKYSELGNYETLRQSLEKMRSHALAHGVHHIAMPRIGCGIDQLQWAAVRTLLKNVFQHDAIAITVYVWDVPEQNIIPGTRAEKKEKPPSEPLASGEKFYEVGFGYRVRQPLPDVFTGMRILLPRSVKNYDVLRRHIIGYGGICLDSDTIEAAVRVESPTHVVQNQGNSAERIRVPETGGPKVRYVTLDWLVASVKLRTKQQERFYPVQ